MDINLCDTCNKLNMPNAEGCSHYPPTETAIYNCVVAREGLPSQNQRVLYNAKTKEWTLLKHESILIWKVDPYA